MSERSYASLRDYDQAVLWVDRRERVEPCALQPRDVEILADLWRYKFLRTDDVAALRWETGERRAPQRRLTKLFRAGYLDRFRPRLWRGSLPWTYALAREGFKLAEACGALAEGARYVERPVFNYQYVLHDLQLNAWVLAYRRHAGEELRAWYGEQESEVEPPKDPRRLRHDGGAPHIEGLVRPEPQLIRPDAVLELAIDTPQGTGCFFVEYDRTRRPDKACKKFVRYDSFISRWWRHSEAYGFRQEAPYAIFVCQDQQHLDAFLAAADDALRGHEWDFAAGGPGRYPGRERILFTDEQDVQRGRLEAWRVPPQPPGSFQRHADAQPHRVALPGYSADSKAA